MIFPSKLGPLKVFLNLKKYSEVPTGKLQNPYSHNPKNDQGAICIRLLTICVLDKELFFEKKQNLLFLICRKNSSQQQTRSA